MYEFPQARGINCQRHCWKTVAISKRMFRSESYQYIDTVSGLTRALQGLWYTQGIKYCTVDRHLCINTSDNDAVPYIGPSFNYTEAFSLLLLTVVTRAGLQEALKNRVKPVTFRVSCQQPEGFYGKR